jgi:8-oxo-dGTP diphosphatase/2-hydroxy-dATP diphosphatase
MKAAEGKVAMKEEKDYTLLFVRKDDEILLGMKKRGFGTGKWNGFGGKIEAGETIEQAAVRELQEESGVVAKTVNRVGYLVFHMEESNKLMKVHVYDCWDYDASTLKESDEMRPKWFALKDIPLKGMWPDDPIWLPLYLKGQRFLGRFEYSDDDTIEDYSLTEQGSLAQTSATAPPQGAAGEAVANEAPETVFVSP